MSPNVLLLKSSSEIQKCTTDVIDCDVIDCDVIDCDDINGHCDIFLTWDFTLFSLFHGLRKTTTLSPTASGKIHVAIMHTG